MGFDFLGSLVGGAVGFLTGGPLGAGAGFLSGGLSKRAGGGGSSGPSLNVPANLDYLDVVRRRAAFNGYQQGFASGGLQQQGGQSSSSSGAQQPKAGSGLSQFANQRGGRNSGGSADGAARSAGQEAGTMPSVNLNDAYRSYLGNAMVGNDTIPNAQNAQFAAGQRTIDAQTHQARQQYLQQMADRGILRSGMTSTGLAEIESGRATSLGDLSARLEAQRQSQLAEAQRNAAALISGQQSQQRAIEAAQPSTGEILGDALGAYAQYQQVRNAPSLVPQAQLLGQTGAAPSSVTTPLLAGGAVGPTTTAPLAGPRTTMPGRLLGQSPTSSESYRPLARMLPDVLYYD